MSVSQILMTFQHDIDLFAPTWRAGLSGSQSLKKSLRNYDIENINVVKTCEKLCLAFNEKAKSRNSLQSINCDKDECVIKKPNIPFRAYSNILFGTLKIYQQQVNTLFRLSRDLFSRSFNYNIKHLEASKRKSSLTSKELVKKPRLILNESHEEPYFKTNYSELLEDLERLAQEPMQYPLVESCQIASGPITHVKIREITIREINSTTYTTPYLIEEDSGFGEATREEIAEFFNFVGDDTLLEIKGTATKRKLNSGYESPVKRCCYNDFLTEPQNGQHTCKTQNCLSSISPTKSADTFDENNIIENNDIIETLKIKKEELLVIEDKQTTYTLGAKKKKKCLIIDECTKIDVSKIISEMKNSNILPKGPRRKSKLSNIRRKTAALDLLTRFNRRSLKLILSLKQKFCLSREQFERDYLNLLREIFKIHYNEKLASEIYPEWKCFKDAFRKQNRKQKKPTSCLRFDTNNLNKDFNTNEMDNNFNEYHETPSTSNCNNIKTLNNTIHEWRPYGVMIKLLNFWRFNQTNEIVAAQFFKLAENRIDKALGFNSVLNLSKAQFVKLTKLPQSIELQYILMGKAVRNKIKNITLY